MLFFFVIGASATWYLVGRGDKEKVAHFFALHGQNIDLEVCRNTIRFSNSVIILYLSFANSVFTFSPPEQKKYFIPESALIEANFTVYKTEQRIGDFVLVPSNSCHQVLGIRLRILSLVL